MLVEMGDGWAGRWECGSEDSRWGIDVGELRDGGMVR